MKYVWILLASVAWSSAAVAETKKRVSFQHDVQPILRRHCFRCHGTKNQEASLQLNMRDAAVGADDSFVIIRENAAESLLMHRVTGESHGDLMPPDSKPLAKSEIQILRDWINQGAEWPDSLAEGKHWAYQPIKRPDVPSISKTASAVDQFILRRLAQAGLAPSEKLDRPRLIRRISLALIGVPPTPEQVRAFVNDQSPGAFEKLVDRLLGSDRFGERWAVPWLDMARYADSNGFQADQIRDNWAYRDWVIRALNEGMPFDEFVIDQLAGDLRPSASVKQKIATGFHRMTTCNVEAGVHPEANRVNQIVDRVNTTATVFMGTTLECAQCHDHKYDPFSQQDYYRLFAFFNNTPLEVKNTSGVTWDFYGPKMDLPMDSGKEQRFDELTTLLAKLKTEREQLTKLSNASFAKWLKLLREADASTIEPQNVQPEFTSTGDEEFQILDDGSVILSGPVPPKAEYTFTIAEVNGPVTAIRVDALTDDRIPGKGPGRGDPKRTNIILSEFICEVVGANESSRASVVRAFADHSQTRWEVSKAFDGNRKTGWAIGPEFGKPHWATFVLAEPIDLGPDQSLRITLDQQFGQGRVIGRPRISVLHADPTMIGLEPKLLQAAQSKKLAVKDRRMLREHFDQNNPQAKALDSKIKDFEKQLKAVQPDTTLVMTEMEEPRDTFVMLRGDYEATGDKVSAGTPAALPSGSPPANANRLHLAKWLTSRQNPLLARVTVNRWWAEIFGVGLVSTPEDFGTQGDVPSHPELLDYLAMELMDSGWSMKHTIKTMVLSNAFQQSANVDKAMLEADPSNRLLARGPRFRMNAELIRDNALVISGLIATKMYGRPVMPYQPDKLWRSIGRNQPKWIAATDQDRFRRGVYVVWKRAAPYPSFVNFDAPNRGSCTVNRGRSNTPLQALTLLNDPAYAEMALAMADRVLSESNGNDEVRLDYAIQLALARNATSREIAILRRLLDHERDIVQEQDIANQRTKLPFKEMVLKHKDKQELAAWFAVCNAILNLDETMTQ